MKKSRWFVAATLVVVAVVAACSSDSDKTSAPDAGTADANVADTSVADTSVAEAGPTSYGCDLVVDGGGHTCSDFVTVCDRTGAVGGCTMTEVKNGITTVTTTWQYAGTVSSVMAICASQAGYTFILP